MSKEKVFHELKRQIKTTYRTVQIDTVVYKMMTDYANSKGMKFTKVVEFAIMDYLTNATK